MIKSFILLILLISAAAHAQFYETNEDIHEENVYPEEDYSLEMGTIQQEESEDLRHEEEELPYGYSDEGDENLEDSQLTEEL